MTRLSMAAALGALAASAGCFLAAGEPSGGGAISDGGTGGAGSSSGTGTGGASSSGSGAGGSSSGGSGSTGGIIACTDDSQCPAGAYCEDGVMACDGGSAGLSIVLPGRCVTPRADGSCTAESDCPAALYCDNGRCLGCPVDAGPPPCRGVATPQCPPHCFATSAPHTCYASVCACPGYGCAPPPGCGSNADCGRGDNGDPFGCCDGGCIDVGGDSANCGGCGVVCAPGTVCEWGSCVSPGSSCTPCECPAACGADGGGICCLSGWSPSPFVCVGAGQGCPLVCR